MGKNLESQTMAQHLKVIYYDCLPLWEQAANKNHMAVVRLEQFLVDKYNEHRQYCLSFRLPQPTYLQFLRTKIKTQC